MKKFFLAIFAITFYLTAYNQSTFNWNFGTDAANPNPSSGTPVAGLTISAVSQGNNNGTTILLTTVSASLGYTGSSGQFNAGAAARVGALNIAASGSAYFEFTLTPEAGKTVSVTNINFGSRSTGTGPQAYTIRTSLDGYASDAATAPTPNNSLWALYTNTISLTSAEGGAVTIRIYGHSGTGTPSANTANWRIDDLSVTVNVTGGGGVPTVSVIAGNQMAEADPATNGSFIFTLSSPAPPGGLSFTYSLTGTATIGLDYLDNLSLGTVTIAEGSTTATVLLTVLDDPDAEPTETVILTIAPPDPGTATIGTGSATINITSNDLSSISLTGVYSQDFNSLANTGTASLFTLPTGWIFSESGTGANTTYTANSGAGTSGDTYSYGTGTNTDRAFGTLQTNAFVSTIGASFTNSTGVTINRLGIAYTGEQWRLGATGRTDFLNFEYSTNATNLTTGTWIPVTELSFASPVNSGTAGSMDGNTFHVLIAFTLPGLSIPDGATFFIRWVDPNVSGADDGIGVDDFSIEPNPLDLTPPSVIALTPANGASDIPTNFTASIVFNETIVKGTGNILLKKLSDNSVVQTIDVTSSAVTVTGTNVSFNLNQLSINTGFYIEIGNGAFKDQSDNNFAGISGNSTWAFTTGSLLFVANFNSCTSALTEGFTQFSAIGPQVWNCTAFGRDPNNLPAGSAPNGVQINGFNVTNIPNEDWLISPSFDLTGTTYPLLSFWSRTAFNGEPLQLKVSLDYVSGDPSAATWIDINGKFPGETSNIWTLSENINLTAFKGANVHFAFVYYSSDDDGARWTLDDIVLNNSATPPPPSLTVSTTGIQFPYTAASNTSTRTFTLIGNDLTNDITLNVTGPFTISKDNSLFSSSLTYTVAEANDIFKTVYVRFAPPVNKQNFSGNILIETGSLSADVALSGTSIDPATTLEVVNWNIEWFGSPLNGPTNDAQQEQNVKTILQNLNADIYAVSEIVSESRLESVVNQMPGYDYVISNYGSHTNPFAPNPSALGEAQKLAFIYKTSLFNNVSTTALLTQGINSAADITNPAYNYWASGRFPFMLSADVTLNCITKNVKFILVHGKANTSPTTESYERRKKGADSLHYTLQLNYPNDNIVILGDYNDDLDESITAGFTVTSWSAFTNDAANYEALTLPLSLAGEKSTVSHDNVIDHVTVSNEMEQYYINATADILTDVVSLVANYGSSTSDHYPVFTRYIFENNIAPGTTNCTATVSLCQNNTNIYTIPAFVAADDCGDVVSYTYNITGLTTRSGNSNDASGTFNLGVSTIIWTATDGWGNTATCQTTVTINANPTVTIPDAFALPSGTLANTVYIGYAPASSITLTASPSGGAPGYSYSWSNGSTISTATVSPVVNTIYSVTITDQNSCQATAQKQVIVMDIRGGKKLEKVNICHSTPGSAITLTVSPDETAIHLSHGDMLGACTAPSGAITRISTLVEAANGDLEINVMPNPSAKNFTLNVTSDVNSPMTLRVIDISGKIIERKNLTAGQSLRIGDGYRPGMYMAEVSQGNERKIVKLVKIQ